MNPIATTKEALSENTKLAQDYANQEFEFARMKLFYQISSLISSIVKKTAVGVFALAAIVFSSIALAMYLGEVLGNPAYGYLIVALMYLLVVGLMYFLRKRMERYVINKLARKYF